MIHRDIKPENVLLHDGQALVADFGIALAVSQASGTRVKMFDDCITLIASPVARWRAALRPTLRRFPP